MCPAPKLVSRSETNDMARTRMRMPRTEAAALLQEWINKAEAIGPADPGGRKTNLSG
jgi:hypothetical protein